MEALPLPWSDKARQAGYVAQMLAHSRLGFRPVARRGVTGQGAYIKFLTPAGAAWRFVTARRRRGRFVPEGASTAEEYQPLPGSEPSSGAVASASGPVDD